MSRSYKRTPIRTILGRMSQHRGKKAASRKFRRTVKMQLQKGDEILPEKSTLIAYRLAYLKAHDPALFYNTLYSSLKWEDDRKALYDDALQHGLVYMDQSGAFYQVTDD